VIRRILVPLDQSPFGEAALEEAADIASRAGASLRLVQVLGTVPTPTLDRASGAADTYGQLQQREAQEYLARVAAPLRSSGPVTETALLPPPAAKAICDDARASDADLIVMSTHGRTGWSRVWIGSVADGVVRRADVPVLLVRPAAPGGEVATRTPKRRVVIPLDGSEAAERVLDLAVEVFGVETATYVLVRVVEPIVRMEVSSVGAPMKLPDPAGTEVRCARARRRAGGVANRLRARWPGADVQTHVEANAHPAQAIVEAAQGADAVAMTSRGRGPSRLLLGSVADKVLRATMASVLVLRRRARYVADLAAHTSREMDTPQRVG
jgi:nucleotide-binding universal stress UspA family protein